MKSLLLVIFLSLIATPLLAKNSHCKADEKIVFSCSLNKSKKIISVCTTNNFSIQNGYFEYRFGNQGKVELTLPVTNTDTKAFYQAVRAKSLMFSGGGGSYLRFINEPYHYVVYSAIGKGWGPKDGVAVEKNQRLLTYWECQDTPTMEMGEEFFSKSGLLIDTNEFVIPGTDK